MEEQPKTEEKYFHIENVGKNIWTTLIGGVMMTMAVGAVVMDWFFDKPTKAEPWQIAVVFLVGFAMLFMRDNVKSYIDAYTKKKIG